MRDLRSEMWHLGEAQRWPHECSFDQFRSESSTTSDKYVLFAVKPTFRAILPNEIK